LGVELALKEPQEPALPQVTDQAICGFEESFWTEAAIVVEALMARDDGGGTRNKIETGFDGCEGSVVEMPPGPHPAQTPITLMPINR
jgi:hypothetical protein